MMSIEDFKVNCIFFWRKNKGYILETLFLLTFPIWLVAMVITLFIVAITGQDDETVDDDMAWCQENHYTYPYWKPLPHFTVKKYKKEVNRLQAAKEKEYIREMLRKKQI